MSWGAGTDRAPMALTEVRAFRMRAMMIICCVDSRAGLLCERQGVITVAMGLLSPACHA